MNNPLFQAAQSAYAANDFQRCFALCADGLRTAPNDATLHNLAAVSAAQLGQHQISCDHARQALGLDPGSDAITLNAALVFERAGHLDEARNANEALLSRQPQHTTALANLANLARLSNDNTGALKLYKRALATKAGDATILANYASLLSLVGRHEDAVDAITRALALQPAAHDLTAAAGDIQSAAGNYQKAIEHYQNALAHTPDRTTLLLNLAVAHLSQRETEQALAFAADVETRDPGNRTAAALRYIAAVQKQDKTTAHNEMDAEQYLERNPGVCAAGYDNLAAFTDALRDEVLAHPSLRFEPTSKTTRGGAQSANLLPNAGPAILALRKEIERHVLHYLDTHPGEAMRAARSMSHFTLNVWVTVLDKGGHQLPHIHPAGVLSGVYYVAVPDPAAGSIEFGMLPEQYGPFEHVNTHTLQPEAGDLFLFPSQFYHRTRAFEHTEQRISIAFDVVPAALDDGLPMNIARGLDQIQQLLRRGDVASAQRQLSTVESAAPRVQFVRGQLALVGGQHDAALRQFNLALQARPLAKQWWYALGLAQQRLMDHSAARDALEHALRIDPAFENARMSLASLHTDLGEADEAVNAYRAIVEHRPGAGRAWYGLALQRVAAISLDDMTAMRTALADDTLPAEDRGGLHFALGRALEHTESFDDAFAHFAQGNQLKRAQQPFDAAAEVRNADAICAAFTPQIFRQFAGAGSPDEQPILIVGMPRSGSTLIEQIIASHPAVAAAGETNALWRTLSGIGRYLPVGCALPNDIAKVPAHAWAELGQSYLEQLRRESGADHNTRRITDKLPFNYTLVGMLRLMLPNAYVIDARRHPMDTCWSCFATSFGVDRGFTNDLSDLGQTYTTYDRLMTHWASVLPRPVYTQHYEDMVAATEANARAMIDALGLEWDDACLAFYRSKRAVTTSSYAQVRQPIYTSSVARWRRFEHLLQPLRKALGPLAPD
ncbi:MAG: sulfotransferase [Gammaproteobacteria bacterium]